MDVQRFIKDENETVDEADCIERVLSVEPAASLLDVPCATGRLSLELCRRGYLVTGVDQSEDMLAQARNFSQREGLAVNWEGRDMRFLQWHEDFDGALCFWNSFGYFDDGDNARFVQCVAQSLRPGGRFVIDTHVLETVLPRFRAYHVRKVGEVWTVEEATYNPKTSTIFSRWVFLSRERVEEKVSRLRLYTYRELCGLLEEAGFSNLHGYSSPRLEPFDLGASRLILVGQKGRRITAK